MRKIFFPIIILVSVASLLRFYNLPQRGIFFYDEGTYINEGRYVRNIIGWFSKFILIETFSKSRASDVEKLVKDFNPSGQYPSTSRPMHNFIVALGLIASGDNINAGNFVMAILGVLSVTLTFFVALKLTGSKLIGFISGLILAVLPYHIFYSRSSLAEIDSQVFFLLSSYTYLIFFERRRANIFLLLSGLLAGLAFTTNAHRLAFLTPLLIETIFHKKNFIKSILIFTSAFVAPILLFEIPYYFAFLLTHNYEIVIKVPTYFEQLLGSFVKLRSQGFNLSMFSYPLMLVTLSGFSFSIALILGIFWTIKNFRQEQYWIIAIPILMTIFSQSIYSFQFARALSPILPAIAIVAAIGIVRIKESIKFGWLRSAKYSGVIVLIFTFIVLAETTIRGLPFLTQHSAFSESIAFLNLQKENKVITTNDSLVKVYNPKIEAINYQQTIAKTNDYSIYINKDYNFILLDPQKFTVATGGHSLNKNLEYGLRLIEENCEAVFRTASTNLLFFETFAFEHNTNFSMTRTFLKDISPPEDGSIYIYNYKKCLKKIIDAKS